ncbi:MAG: chromosomal replication initiator protein DnaA, partial [Rhodocyclaceae bacterium]|nr:chromosomal replication initiator protein DnaA [Rhodocyclaceae bacterium]
MTQEFWTFCLTRLQGELPPQQFSTWIKTLRAEDSGAETPLSVRIVAPNRFILDWVRDRYARRINELGKEFYGAECSVALGLPLNGEPERPAQPVAAVVPPANTAPPPVMVVEKPASPAKRPAASGGSGYDKTRLNADFTFDTLVTGRANDLARAAAMQVADNPGVSYNPLFVYGGVGLGKTHLIHALGNEVYRRNPKAVIRYVHAEDYYADVVRAYQQKSFDVFKR